MKPTDERFDAKTTVLIENVDAPHRGGGAGLVPQGPRGPGPQPAPRDRRRDGAAKEKAPRRPAQPSALKKTVDAVIA